MDKFNSDISKITREGNELVTQHYSDITPLHESGNGAFCLFRASRFGKRLVLKALKPQFRGDPFYEAILQKEFMIGDSLSHPGIVSTIDYTNLPETGNCIVLEYINGVTLRQYLIDNNPLPKNEAKRIITSICEATGYLHSTKITHRDLKPENIMVERHTGKVKIIDLGCADASEYDIIKGPAGTRHYAAPEQLAPNGIIDARTDIFAIGKIILDIIEATGKPNKHLTRIALRCTATAPADRYSSTEAIKKALNKKGIINPLMLIIFGIIALAGFVGLFWSNSQANVTSINIAETTTSIADTSTIDFSTHTSHPVGTTPQSIPVKSINSDSKEIAPSISTQPSITKNTEQAQQTTGNNTIENVPHSTPQNTPQPEYSLNIQKADSIYSLHAKYIREYAEWKIGTAYSNFIVLSRTDEIKPFSPTIDDIFSGKKTSKYTDDVRADLSPYVSGEILETYIMRLEQLFNSIHIRYRKSDSFRMGIQPFIED